MPAEPLRRGGEVLDVRVVKALAHPTRVRILGVLRDRELASPVELAAELGLALGTVGYHVRRLEALGFIELAKRTQRRGAVEHHYRTRAALDLPPAPAPERQPASPLSARRAVSRTSRGDQALGSIEEAHAALARGGFDDVAALAERRTLKLDARGCARLHAAAEHWRAALERVERASARRHASARGGRATHACTAVVMLFEAPADVPGVVR